MSLWVSGESQGDPSLSSKNCLTGANKMLQWVNMLATKLGELSLIPTFHS